jgi:hypothetical protein
MKDVTQEKREKVRDGLKVLFECLNNMPVNYIIMFFLLDRYKQGNHFNEYRFRDFWYNGTVYTIEDNSNVKKIRDAIRMLDDQSFDFIYSEALNYIKNR